MSLLMAFFGKLASETLAKVALGALDEMLKRKDLKDSVRKDFTIRALKFAKDAEEVRTWAARDPDAARLFPHAGGRWE